MKNQMESLLPMRKNELINEYLYMNHLSPQDLETYTVSLPDTLSEDRSVIDAYLHGAQMDKHFSSTGMMSHKEVIPEREKVGVFLHPRFSRVYLHKHDFLEIKYMAMGSIRMPISQNYITLNEGDFCFILPETSHYVDIHDRNTLLINFVVRTEDIADVFRRIFTLDHPLSEFIKRSRSTSEFIDDFLICCSDGTRISQLILECYNQKWKRPDQPVHRLMRESILEQIVLKLIEMDSKVLRSGKDQDEQIPQRFFPILFCIQDQCDTITFEEVCSRFHYSKAYLSRMISRYTGVTFTELVQKERLRKASHLLKTTNLSIDEIMHACGYHGTTHFYRIFTQNFGLTPAMYRSSHGDGSH